MKSYLMKYEDYGSGDISFCNATDCRTKCKRNQNLPFFKKYLQQIKEYDGRYAVADFKGNCSFYAGT